MDIPVWFIHSWFNGLLDYFYSLAIITNAAMNICMLIFARITGFQMSSILLSLYLGLEFLDNMVILCLIY